MARSERAPQAPHHILEHLPGMANISSRGSLRGEGRWSTRREWSLGMCLAPLASGSHLPPGCHPVLDSRWSSASPNPSVLGVPQEQSGLGGPPEIRARELFPGWAGVRSGGQRHRQSLRKRVTAGWVSGGICRAVLIPAKLFRVVQDTPFNLRTSILLAAKPACPLQTRC